MKITKIVLKNFLGLYNGSGKKEIEIDFTKGSFDNKITILSGGNGKGKSFLISCLHPFASTLDNRKEIIIKGENGYKEVHYDIDSNKKVIIKHNYMLGRTGKITMKSFFALSEDNGKTFKELNPNGTVTSFKDLVLKHLEVDEAYFKIARVGTNVTGFIDMPTAERKKYISLFLPDVDIYLENYKKINDQYNTLNKNIKYITQEIDKIDSEDNIKANLNNTLNSLLLVTNSLESTNEVLNKNLGAISQIDPNGDVEKIFLDEYNTFKKNKTEIEKYDSSIKQISDGLSETDLKEIQIKLSSEQQKLEHKKERLQEYQMELIESDAKIEELEIKLSKYELDSEEELKDILAQSKEQYSDLKTTLNSKPYKSLIEKYKDLNLKDLDQAINFLSYYKEETETIMSQYNLDELTDFKSNLYTMVELNENKSELNSKIGVLNNRYSKLTIERKSLESKLELVDVLKSRPLNCSIDSCPFISNALKYKDTDEKIEKIDMEIDQNRKEKEKLEKDLEYNARLIQLASSLMNLQKQVKFFTILEKLPYYEYYSTYENLVQHFMSDKGMMSFTEIKNTIELYNEYISVSKNIENLELRYEAVSNKRYVVDGIKTEINTLREKAKSISSKVSDLKDDILIIEKDIEENKDIERKLIKVEELRNEKDEITSKQKELRSSLKTKQEQIEELKQLKLNNRELTEKVKKYESQIKPLEKEKDRLNLDLRRLHDFNEKRKQLEEDYNDLAVIRDALSTTKGIPLLFIDLYLKKIKNIANELLDISFQGKFFIEDFIVTESDFFISVRKSEGELVNDIAQASQGEQALVSIALSFALVQQSTRAYNVLALDEMDSTLDSRNRQAFIEVIETQLKEMNVEQCFIISHNEAFDTYPVNLILFEGTNVDINDKEYMKNKNVLYQNK